MAAYVVGVGFVALTVAFASISGRPADHFTRDPLAIMDAPAYVGFLSNVGIAMWFSAAAMAWMAAVVLRQDAASRMRSAAMFAAAAMITLLGLDDLFMLHEETLQRHMGISEKITVFAYVAMVGGIAIAFRRTWLDSPWRWIIPAGLFFTASIAVDFLSTGFGWRLVIEDSFKFMGIVGIVAWMLATAQAWLMPHEMPSVSAA